MKKVVLGCPVYYEFPPDKSKITVRDGGGLMGKSPPNKGKLANYTAASTRNSTDRPDPSGPSAVFISANGDMQKL